MHQVTLKDFPQLNLGDIRRNERFVSIINNISNSPGSSIPGQNTDWYSTKATYEFYKNEDVSLNELEQIISSYGRSLVSGADSLLIAHDFCQISYNDSAAEGLGYLAKKEGRGVIAYNSIAISTAGIPLALLYQHNFVRQLEELGKAKKRASTPFEEKESYHWYNGITKTNGFLGNSIHKIHIADREADIYELFSFVLTRQTPTCWSGPSITVRLMKKACFGMQSGQSLLQQQLHCTSRTKQVKRQPKLKWISVITR